MPKNSVGGKPVLSWYSALDVKSGALRAASEVILDQDLSVFPVAVSFLVKMPRDCSFFTILCGR